MHVYCLNSLDELATYADDWDRLAGGMPFRGWTWLSTWWRHYGGLDRNEPSRSRPAVYCVFDEADVLVGLAPWYLDASATGGRVLRMLGSGEVCTDYQTVLCQRGMEEAVTRALADRLTDEAHATSHEPARWNLLELTGVDAEDRVVGRLAEHLAAQGNTVDRRPAMNCRCLELPTTWDAYLAMLSTNRRQQFRKLHREYFDTGRVVARVLERSDELPFAMDLLVDFHQRRRQSLGDSGCFAWPRFAAFYREVVPALYRIGSLQFHWLELDGKPVAAEYLLAGNGVLYAYQGGVDPDAIQHRPGYLINIVMIRQAIEQGYREFDFLRGDEQYKLHLRAQARPSVALRIVPDRAAAQWRHSLWLAKGNMKRWIKRGLQLAKK